MIHIVANKRSGGYSRDKIREIEDEFSSRGIKFTLTETVKAGTKVTAQIDKSNVEKGDIIIAAGGDGTVNACLQYIHDNSLQQKVKLGVIPLGTGNNLIKTLRLNKKLSSSVRIILKGNTERISYGIINKSRVFFNCSVGFPSYVLNNRKTNSLLGYVFDGLRLIPKFKGSILKQNGKKMKIFAGFFINTSFYMSKFRFLKKNNNLRTLSFFYLPHRSVIENAVISLSCLSGISRWNKKTDEIYNIEPVKDLHLEIDGDIYEPGKCDNIFIQNVSDIEIISNKVR